MCEILHKFGELGGSFARGRSSLAIYIHQINPNSTNAESNLASHSRMKQIKHEIKTKMVVTSQGTGSDRYMKGSNFLAKGNLEEGILDLPHV